MRIYLNPSNGIQNTIEYIDKNYNDLFKDFSTHWSRVTHICIGKLTIIGSDNDLSPGQCQAIVWTNAGILLTGPLGTKFRDNLITIKTFLFTKMHLKMSSGKCQPSCLGLNVLNTNLTGKNHQQYTWITMYPSLNVEGILPKGPYPPCVSMAGRALLAGYHRGDKMNICKA